MKRATTLGTCSNCGEAGEVSVSVPCPECKGRKGITLHDNADVLLRLVKAGVKIRRGDAFGLTDWQHRAGLVLQRLGLD